MKTLNNTQHNSITANYFTIIIECHIIEIIPIATIPIVLVPDYSTTLRKDGPHQ